MSLSMRSAMQTDFRTIDGLRIRFAESEQRDDHALLLSPWPETLYAFEQMWDRLGRDTHLVAVDLPGFGHSEGSDSLYAPRAMGEFVTRFADEFRLEQPHIVGPDIGTSAALFAAADNPRRYRSLVVGSGGVSYPLELGGSLQGWVEAPDLNTLRRGDGRQVVAGAIHGLERYPLPEFVREDYMSAYEGERFAESAKYVRAYPTELPVLANLLPTIETPVQIICAMWDAKVPPSNNRYLHKRLPNSRLDLIDAAHFPWEDAPGTYADLVTTWWAGGYETNRPKGWTRS